MDFASDLTIEHCHVSNLPQEGIFVNADGARVGISDSTVISNMISNNLFFGIKTDSAGSKAWASGNTVNGSSNGFYNSGGVFETAGNNAVRNNTFSTSGTISPVVPTI